MHLACAGGGISTDRIKLLATTMKDGRRGRVWGRTTMGSVDVLTMDLLH